MKSRGIIDPLLAGDFEGAIQKGCYEWASFPDNNKGDAEKNPKSHYSGQPAAPISWLRDKYDRALGVKK